MIRSCRIPAVLNRICDPDIVLGPESGSAAGTSGNATSTTTTTTSKRKKVIVSALLVTGDGELLGCSTTTPPPHYSYNTTTAATTGSCQTILHDPESFGSLIADMAVEYRRLGHHELASVDAVLHRNRSELQCLLLDLEAPPSTSDGSGGGMMVGVAVVSLGQEVTRMSQDCFVIAVAAPDAPPGLFKARLQALAVYTQESLSTLTEQAA